MIINNLVIEQKLASIRTFSNRTLDEITTDLKNLFGDISDVTPLSRPWSPGGGAALFQAALSNERVFVKIKDKSLFIENRLECETEFPTIGSLSNEAMFCRVFSDEASAPKLKSYKEDRTYAYAVFETLTSFDHGVAALDAYELYEAFRQIESFVRKMYDKGVVHTDIHEKNIMFRGKQPVLIDFEEARLLSQNVSFKQSLDVVGENRYGKLGEFPEGHGIPGLACLDRLRKVFKPLIKQTLPALLEKCHFSNDCPFNVDDLQDKDERIYQSIDLGDTKYAGQRPLQDKRVGILERLLEKLGPKLGSSLHTCDIGSNLGMMSFTANRSEFVSKSIGIEAFPEYVQVSRILSFMQNQDDVVFSVGQAGVDPLPKEPIDLLFLFSVYHHVRDKDAFLRALVANRPRVIITEFATQERYYPQRGNAEKELAHIKTVLGYKYFQLIGITSDYQRPICLLSDLPLFEPDTLNYIMTGSGDKKSELPIAPPPSQLKSYPVEISVVLPTYNHVKFLPEALKSILAQTHQSFELIVVNDGSTDETAALLKQISHPNIRVITTINQGLPAALNRGFADARGKYWTWTSADNVVGPTWLEELYEALEESPVNVGYALSSFANINDNGQIIGVEDKQCFETHRMFVRNGNASFLYRAELAKEVGSYDEQLGGAEDLDMWLRMSSVTRAVHVESVLYYYRLHHDSMTAKVPAKITDATKKAIVKFMDRSKGTFDIDRIFPGVLESKDPSFARWQARVWLATQLSQSPFWPITYIVDLYVSALVLKYESGLVGNIVILLARNRSWGDAAQVVAACLPKDNSPFLQQLAEMVAQKDQSGIEKLHFVTVEDSALTFDRHTQLSRSKLTRIGAPR